LAPGGAASVRRTSRVETRRGHAGNSVYGEQAGVSIKREPVLRARTNPPTSDQPLASTCAITSKPAAGGRSVSRDLVSRSCLRFRSRRVLKTGAGSGRPCDSCTSNVRWITRHPNSLTPANRTCRRLQRGRGSDPGPYARQLLRFRTLMPALSSRRTCRCLNAARRNLCKP